MRCEVVHHGTANVWEGICSICSTCRRFCLFQIFGSHTLFLNNKNDVTVFLAHSEQKTGQFPLCDSLELQHLNENDKRRLTVSVRDPSPLLLLGQECIRTVA